MFNFIIYKFGQFLSLALPRKAAYAFAVFCADIHYAAAKNDRQAVWGNLKAIFPDKDDKELHRIRRRLFRNFAKYLVDFFRIQEIDRAFIEKRIAIENKEYLDEGLARGKGVIALSAHLGNWELGGIVVALLKYPFWAVALRHKEALVDKFFNAQRTGKNVNVIPFGRAVRACLSALNGNGVVALLGDRDFSEKGMRVDFFGRPTLFPEGPAVFALKQGAAIVPVFMLRRPDDSFVLRFEKPLIAGHSFDHKAGVHEVIVSYKGIIEDYIRRYPDQWYMFRRFWI